MVVVTTTDCPITESVFGATYERKQPLRNGAIRELTRQGKNTPWAWCTKEHEVHDPFATDLAAMRPATKKEIASYHNLKKVID